MAAKRSPAAKADQTTVSMDPPAIGDPIDPAPATGGGTSSKATPKVITAIGQGAWMMPAPVAYADAPTGSSGHLMGIKVGGPAPATALGDMLGTSSPRASWPN